MRKGGLEPPRDFSHYHLKVARIPFRHFRNVIDELKAYQFPRNIRKKKTKNLMPIKREYKFFALNPREGKMCQAEKMNEHLLNVR